MLSTAKRNSVGTPEFHSVNGIANCLVSLCVTANIRPKNSKICELLSNIWWNLIVFFMAQQLRKYKMDIVKFVKETSGQPAN
jgi:hypothetical protein